MPKRLEQWMYPITKTDLDVLRFAHFLALAAVTVRFLPKDWAGLKSRWLRPLILCGQHSLEIFCLGVFLAFAGHFVLAEVSRAAPALHFARQRCRNRHHVAAWRGSFRGTSIRPTRVRRETKGTVGNADMAGGGCMKSDLATLLGLTLLAGFAGRRLVRARAGCRPPDCEVPAYLLTTESPLPKVEAAIESGRPLEILVVGSRSSTISTSEASAYPGTAAGDAEGEAAQGRGQRLRRTTGQEDRRGSRRRPR